MRVSSLNDSRPYYTFVKRQRHDAGLRGAAADVDVDLRCPVRDSATGTYAIPIAFFRNGVCVPLVTLPTGSPPLATA